MFLLFITEYNDLLENWLLANGFNAEHANIYGNPVISKRTHIAKAAIAKNILSLVDRYGPTGFDDKPKDMDVVEYWLAHIDYDNLVNMRFYFH